ncbi:MAG: transposase, partial [Actinobacteria bacterium]|nr:transposase [Actinomycetota bacterium]
MKHRKAVTREVQDRYVKATKKVKTKILDEFCTTTGYNRVYAARILRLKVGKVIGYA